MIEPLGTRHKKLRDAFSCGEEALDRYLKQQARQDMDSGAALPFVLIASGCIAGYYTLSAYCIRADDIPQEQMKKLRLPRYNVIGATLLGRLAVDLTVQGTGIGELLLLDAMKKALDGSRTIAASTGLVVEAKNDNAQRFYARYGFFAPFPDTPKRLFMRMETIAKLPDRFFPLVAHGA
jgi:GNAT superfamily N-acetyltransferase